ncbi:MAG: hypothetical protein QNK05_06070 [Myxococcota bacterium]|nr:hypothetical protein [Myxococcota bacterium]
MAIRRVLVAASLLLLVAGPLSGCTNRNTWKPTIDPYNNPNAARLSADEAQCRQIANEAAGGKGGSAAARGVMSGLLGAATGAAIGAIFGDAGQGAASGAIAGTVSGGVGGAASSDAHFKRVFSNCLRNRGHNVLD